MAFAPVPGDRQARAILAMFYLQALAGGGLFARIPDIESALALTETQLGLALTGASAGGLVCVLYAGRLVARIGARPVLLWGILAEAALSVAVPAAPDLALLILAFVAHGVAFSAANVAMNIEAGRVEAVTGLRIMNRCHGVWALGMLSASLVGVAARAAQVTPVAHFALLLPLMAALTLWVATWMDSRRPPARAIPPRLARPGRMSWLLMLYGLSAGVAQIGTQSWSVIFMRDTFAAPAWVDTLTLPAYLLALSLGRLFADGLVTRHGAARVSAASTGLALLGAVLVVGAPSLWPALVGFGLIGVGGAVLYPLMVSAAARTPGRPPEESVAAVILLYGLAVLVTPVAMGAIAETWGLRAAFGAVVPTMLVTLALVRLSAPRG